jgi:hypothetical protein
MIIFALIVISASVFAQASRSVWDGVYGDGEAPHFQVVNHFGFEREADDGALR